MTGSSVVVRKAQSPEILRAIEEALVQHRAFGDSAYILDQLQVCYKRRLRKISAHLPVAEKLLDAIESSNDDTRYRLIGDTVIRCAIQHAHSQVETNSEYGLPLPECEKVFAAAARHIELGKSGSPLDSDSAHLHRLGPEPYHGWVWSEEHPNDIFGRSFRYIVKQNYHDSLCTPNEDDLAMLAKGEQLLRDLLPLLAPSALSHAHLIGCFPDIGFWKGKASSSQFRIGGTIFLSRLRLHSPWWIAEHLLHESLHQKLYDFRHGHSLLEPEFSREDAPKVCSLWNPEGLNEANHWDTHRAFAAFHVYVHLALLATLAEERAPELEETYGPLSGMLESRKAFERAHYLGEKLKELCWNELGLAGKGLVEWLTSVLDFLDPSPPPKGSSMHLLLDLYQREAQESKLLLMGIDSTFSNIPRQLIPLAKEEVASTRKVLASINAEPELIRFNDAVALIAEEELGMKFPEVRRIISKTLLDASPDGYGLTSRAPESADPDALVKQMVDSASQRLHLVLMDIPPAVASAKRRARKMRFGMICDDLVGRLLATLAASVPMGGRILEIGTGVGVGAAWISDGLGERTDVELVTLEIDPILSEAAREWPWPEYVQIVTGDAINMLGTLGTYNLVFADASPVKYGNMESTLKALRPRGIIVIDDLRPNAMTTEVQLAEKDALRRLLLRHPKLNVVELDWSSGVIIATNSDIPNT